MKENFDSKKTPAKEMPPEETTAPSTDRYEMQRLLIEDFCKIKGMNDAQKRNTCAMEWIEKYADNFDQIDKGLIEKYKNTKDEQERKVVLDEIQKALEELDRINS